MIPLKCTNGTKKDDPLIFFSARAGDYQRIQTVCKLNFHFRDIDLRLEKSEEVKKVTCISPFFLCNRLK